MEVNFGMNWIVIVDAEQQRRVVTPPTTHVTYFLKASILKKEAFQVIFKISIRKESEQQD
jgi:hypothetical protein